MTFKKSIALLLLALWSAPVFSQDGATRAVKVYAETQASPPQITLHWDTSPFTVEVFNVFRRAPGATTWIYLGNNPAPTATSFVDTNVVVGERYEYKVYRKYVFAEMSFHARGYTIAGIDAPLLDQRGTVVLVIDASQEAALATEITRFKSDLAGDGWTVVTETVAPGDTPASVRAKLQTRYNADPANVKAAILLGRIPVPYSGDINPDGHIDHKGAWPADTYYADLTGTWTDTTVNTTTANQTRNHNIPGDGKFDQNNLPSDADIAIGRIDMANLSGFSAGATETELLRNYLRKNHEFRHQLGAYADVPRRGLIRDGFGSLSGESPASVAWRGFTAMFGSANVTISANWFSTLETNKYLWAYGSGPGSYTSASSIGSSTDFKTKTSLAVFNILFGSYFGDWDSPSDNFLRAPLAGAADSLGLVSTWGNRPDWQIHGMTLGETIGDAYLRSVNNPSDWSGNWNIGYFTRSENLARGVHTALMGDPTLRLHPIPSPASGSVARVSGEGVDQVQLTWSTVPEPDLIGYHIYRSDNPFGPFIRLTTSPTTDLFFTDSSAPQTVLHYQVRAVATTPSASGTYQNAGQALAFFAPVAPPAAPTGFAADPASAFALSLSWTPDPLAASHRLELSPTGAPGSWTLLDDALAGGSASFTDTGLSPETSYFYRIRSTNAVGDSPWSTTASATTFPDAPLAVVLPASTVDETSGSFTATVARADTAGSQMVFLSSDDPRFSVPQMVSFPDGQAGVEFTVTVTDDAELNPSDQASITAFFPEASTGEPFLYSNPSALPAQNGGWGFSGAWVGDAYAPTISSGVTYTKAGTLGGLSTAAAQFANGSGADGSGISTAYRNLVAPVSTGQVWVSWLQARNTGNWSTGMELRSDGGGSWLSVNYKGSTDNNWALVQDGVRTPLVTGNTSPSVHFFVVQLDFEADLIRIWMDPDVAGTSPANSLETAEIAMTNAASRSLGRLLITGYSNANQTIFDQMDEIRVADTFVQLYGGLTASSTVTLIDDEAPPPPIALWRQEHFSTFEPVGDAAPNADPDEDGILNLMEYALGGDPNVPHSAPQAELGFMDVDNESYLTFSIQRNPDATDIVFEVQSTTDLTHGTWPGGVIVVEDSPNLLKVRLPTPLSAETIRFLRLAIQAQP